MMWSAMADRGDRLEISVCWLFQPGIPGAFLERRAAWCRLRLREAGLWGGMRG